MNWPPNIHLGSTRIDDLTEAAVVDHIFAARSIRRGGVVVTPNLSILRRARKSEVVAEMLAGANLSICDGYPVLLAARVAGLTLDDRVTGADLIYSLSRRAADLGFDVAIVGGQRGAAESAASNLRGRSPNLEVSYTACPPLGFESDADEMGSLRLELRSLNPAVVFLGLGFPKQEFVAFDLAKSCPESWFICCGAAIDFAGGVVARSPRFLQKAGLEWLYRLAREPGRLWRRYLLDALFLPSLAAQCRQERRGRSSR